MSRKKIDKLILMLIKAKHFAQKLNRWRTVHKIDDALKEAGWELADIRMGKQKIGSEA